MNRFIKGIFILACLLLFPALAAAQPAEPALDLDGGYVITLPPDWELTEAEEGGFNFDSPDGLLRINTPERLSTMGFEYDEETNVVDVLVEITEFFEDTELDRNDVEKLRFGTRAGAGITIPDDGIEVRNIVATLNNGEVAFFSFFLGEGDSLEQADVLNGIVASFDLADAASATETETDTASPASTIACIISTSTANTAQLRVGPGFNRGAISFLPANTGVSATGRIELEDGSVWYQLDKAEAAPDGTAAAELWVLEDDVTLTGDCQNVGATNAPPVIRAAPQVVPPASGDASSGEAPAANSTPTASLLSPRDGAYIMTLAPVINASCTGGENVPLNTAQVYEGEINYDYYIEVIDANSFYYGEDIYRRYPGSNSFDGIFTYEGGEQSSARIDIISPTMVHGEINDLFQYDGYSCAATLLFDAYLN